MREGILYGKIVVFVKTWLFWRLTISLRGDIMGSRQGETETGGYSNESQSNQVEQ
jgi:hypothetical protein